MMPTHIPAWETEDVSAARETVRQFIAREFVTAEALWRQQGRVDASAWRAAGTVGMLCPDIPERFGGVGASFAHGAVVFEELAYAGITSFGNSVQTITAHYLLAYGSEQQKRKWLPGIASGELICAIAMSEPGAGSDLQGIRTTSVRDGEHYVIDGSKTFISNGQIANLICVVTKTAPAAGSRGISLIMIETDQTEGFHRGRALEKVGQHGQDTSELFFENCRVPATNLLGEEENKGFYQMMEQLPMERLLVAIMGVATTERAIELTVDYTQERQVFGKPIAQLQNTRFRLAECYSEARIGRIFVDYCIMQHMLGKLDPATASMAKLWITEKQCEIVDQCVQFFGGYGYMLEYPIAQMYLDSRAQKIYAGSNEIMKELISRNLLGGKAG